MFSVFCVENPLMDIIAHVDYSFLARFGKKPGTMHLVEYEEVRGLLNELPASRTMPGGSAANTARGIAWLSGGAAEPPSDAAEPLLGAAEPPVFNGAVGLDERGDAYQKSLSCAGVVTSLARKNTPTGVSLILVTPDGERTMNTCLGACRDFGITDLDFGRLAQARLLYLTGYLWDTGNQRAAAEAASAFATKPEHGIPVAFDLADPFVVRRYGHLFREWIPKNVDILFGNRDELALLTESSCDEDCVSTASAMAPVVIMKVGGDGCWVGWNEERLSRGEKTAEKAVRGGGTGHACVHVPGVKVQPIDSTGAGDAFAAGFLHGWLSGYDLKESARMANTLASRIVSVEGCSYESLDGDSGSPAP